jgi:putative FmdB family regulatory protein
MPIYEYKCNHCGVFEVTQRITENALKKCPTCKAKIERIISATSFVLKGSGWYATDYASKPKSDSTATDSSTSDSTASSSSGVNGAASPDGAAKDAATKPAKSAESSNSTTSKSAGSKSGSSPSTSDKSAAKAAN